jgi:hypothetical protein
MTGKLRCIALLGVVWSFGGLGWATNSACPTSAASFSSLPAGGCEAVNLNFTNFGFFGQSQGSPAPTTPTTSNTDVVTSGTSVISPISLQFNGPTTGSACGDGSTLWCLDTGGTQAACPSPNQADQCYTSSGFALSPVYTVTVDQSQTPAPPGEHYAITAITLGVANPVMTGGFASPNGNGIGTAGSDIKVFAFICLGGPEVGDCSTPVEEIEFEIINLGPSDGGIQTIAGTCFDPGCGNGVPGLTLAIPTGVTQVGFEIVAGGNWAISGLASMDAFSLTFDEGLESPEPSTFVLVGLGIVGFAIFRNRYRFWHFGQK